MERHIIGDIQKKPERKKIENNQMMVVHFERISWVLLLSLAPNRTKHSKVKLVHELII